MLGKLSTAFKPPTLTFAPPTFHHIMISIFQLTDDVISREAVTFELRSFYLSFKNNLMFSNVLGPLAAKETES